MCDNTQTIISLQSSVALESKNWWPQPFQVMTFLWIRVITDISNQLLIKLSGMWLYPLPGHSKQPSASGSYYTWMWGAKDCLPKVSQGLFREAYFTSFQHLYPLSSSSPSNVPPVVQLKLQPSWKLLGSALSDIFKLVLIPDPMFNMMSKVCLKKDCYISKAVVVMDYVMQVGVSFTANIG